LFLLKAIRGFISGTRPAGFSALCDQTSLLDCSNDEVCLQNLAYPFDTLAELYAVSDLARGALHNVLKWLASFLSSQVLQFRAIVKGLPRRQTS
jgi:hypothetical protein